MYIAGGNKYPEIMGRNFFQNIAYATKINLANAKKLAAHYKTEGSKLAAKATNTAGKINTVTQPFAESNTTGISNTGKIPVSGINMKAVGILGIAAAGLYFFILKKR